MTDGTSASSPSLELDDEAKRLALEAAKAGYLKEILTAQAGMLAAAVPAVEGAPTGKTTLAESAGSYGPWLAHQALDEAAKAIAEQAKDKLHDAASAVLVVERRDLLSGQSTYRQVTSALDDLKTRIGGLKKALEAACADLKPEPVIPQDVLERLVAEAEGRDVQGQSGSHGRAPAAGLHEVEEESPSRAAPGSDGRSPADTALGASIDGLSGLGALPAALGLLQLVATDYDVASVPVSSSTSELATLVAARLAGTGKAVFVDEFVTMPDASPTVALWRDVAQARGEVVTRSIDVSRVLAGLEAEVDVRAKRVTAIEEAWRTAATMEKDKAVAGRADDLHGLLTTETAKLTKLKSKAAAARSAIALVVSEVTAVDAVRLELAKTSDAGASPIRTALSQERLGGAEGISHVLYVELNHNGADSQTRRLVLGESGRLVFMGSANASWLLLEAEDSRIVAGGHVAKANRMVYDLATGQTSTIDPIAPPEKGKELGTDPALDYEKWAKGLIVVVALFLVVISVLAVVNLALR